MSSAPAPSSRPSPLPLTRGGALDALRFLAAFFMVVYHYSQEGPVPLSQVHPLFTRGYLATDFFLIVSGYVLGRIYGERVAADGIGGWEFFQRRAQRVVPAHLIMIGCFLLLVAAGAVAGVRPQHPEYLSWPDLPGELFLVQALGVPGGQGWNSPTWTLSALLVCYAAFPFIWRLQSRVARPAWVLAGAVVLLVAADVISSHVIGRRIYEFPSEVGVVRALPLFLLGVAIARISQTVYIKPGLARIVTVLAGLGVVGLQFLGAFDFASIVLITLLVMGAGAIPTVRPSHLLEKGALVSFALFITNEFVRNVYFGIEHALAHRLPVGTASGWAAWWVALAAAVGFAVAFHYMVDMPTQGWIKRLRKARRRAPAPLRQATVST